jgi:hypothetical protein
MDDEISRNYLPRSRRPLRTEVQVVYRSETLVAKLVGEGAAVGAHL